MGNLLSAHLLYEFDDDWQRRLRAKLDSGIKLTVGREIPESPDYEILVGGRPKDRHFDACPKCNTLIIPFAGMPASTGELMRTLPHIAVHNLHHNAAPTAEMAMTLLMAAAKRIAITDAAFRRHDWRSGEASEEILLDGLTALILGYGSIGERIGRACRALGMNVIGIRRQRKMGTEQEIRVEGIEQLEELLPTSNVLFVSLPLTKQTEGLLDKDRLALLPDNAIIVNIARGAIINERALYTELNNARLRAGLDVWYNYPKTDEEHADCAPSSYPFGELRNVVMTPHIGGNSDRTEELRIEHLAQLLNAAVRGEPIPNRIDVMSGY